MTCAPVRSWREAWLQGKSEMSDDLALLVSGMSLPLDAMANSFLSTIGAAAKAASRSSSKPGRQRAPDPAKVQPTPEAPPAPTISLDELMRRRRERDRAARLERFARYNDEAWRDQAEMVRRMGWRDE